MSETARLRAARAIANGATNAAAAREAGVDRATVGRWLKDVAFTDMVLQAKEQPKTPEEQAIQGLSDLVPLALKVLEDGLLGKDISPQQQQVARQIIRDAKTLEPRTSADEGPSSLTTLIAELDARD